MAILDKAKSATGRARGQAKHGAAVGQARLRGTGSVPTDRDGVEDPGDANMCDTFH